MQRGYGLIYILVGVMVLVLLGGIYYFNVKSDKNVNNTNKQVSQILKPSPTLLNETTNWKTYTNNEYKYSINYPPDWKVIEAKPRVGNQTEWTGNILVDDEAQKVTFLDEKNELYQGWLQIRVSPNLQNLTLEQWTKNYKEPNAANPKSNLASLVGDTTIDGKLAKKFGIFTFQVPGESAIVTINNRNIYYLRYADWSEYVDTDIPSSYNAQKYPKIIDQMLSTFKFN